MWFKTLVLIVAIKLLNHKLRKLLTLGKCSFIYVEGKKDRQCLSEYHSTYHPFYYLLFTTIQGYRYDNHHFSKGED